MTLDTPGRIRTTAGFLRDMERDFSPVTRRERQAVRQKLAQRVAAERRAADRAWEANQADLDRGFALVRADLAKPYPVSTPEGIIWVEAA